MHKNGRIEGLMNELTIEKDLVELITKDPDEFHKFYDEHREEIVKYYFVFYACSLDENAKSFPLALKRKTNGSADTNITADLEELVFRCEDLGLEVMGISFDGDKSYLKYINEMCEEIEDLETLNLKEPLLSLFKKYSGILGYEDLLHFVKCNRYRLVCRSKICSSMSNDDETFDPDDLLDIGIKEHLLDSSKQKKKKNG